MCGFAGFVNPAGVRLDQAKDVVTRMADRLAHRGPDDHGAWVEETAGVALAHRRLSILDLSPAGHQPMVSEGGRFVLAFNGEIYNHLVLRSRLGVASWRGHSDTETLLAAIVAWGVEGALEACVGMFAFALWDQEMRTLTLARDRMGEKPLYYGWQGGVLLFGSELKALREHPAFEGEVDRNALALMLRHNHIPSPYSIYRGIQKVVPGTYWQVTLSDRRAADRGQARTYWSMKEVAHQGQSAPFAGSFDEAVSELELLLGQALAGQMIADVPLGAFLSGGIDSSTVVALMQARASHPVKTFSIGFNETGYDEAEHARAVARHLGTEHTELYVTPDEARAVIPRLPDIYDEPFSDVSQIPTFLLSQMAKHEVTVALSGDAGDELFGGYTRYVAGVRLARQFSAWPKGARLGLAFAVDAVPSWLWDRVGHAFGVGGVSESARKLADIAGAGSREAVYRELVSHWKRPEDVVIGAQEPPTLLSLPGAWPDFPDFGHCMMYLDALGYLPDDILVKVDRAAMAVSLETRVPFLDHRVVEFAWRLPIDMKIQQKVGKWVVRKLLYRYVPKTLIERPKMGFGVPIGQWLRGPLRDWAEALLDESRLRCEAFLNPVPIRAKWAEHLSGKRNWQYYLWDVLMFQAWLRREKNR